MIVILDPKPPMLRWYKIKDGLSTVNRCEFSANWPRKIAEDIRNLKQVREIGYVLHHGGEEIKAPLLPISPPVIDSVWKCTKFLPEHNNMTLETIKMGLKSLPKVKHVLLCDTAYFLNLPPEASTYAVPSEFRQIGMKRYGGYGLRHQWLWTQAQHLMEKPLKKMVSVYIGDQTNLAAIRDGSPVETTIGFSSVEEIPSLHSCGDIDPEVVFQLEAAGVSSREITNILSKKSGLCGLIGKDCTFLDLMQNFTHEEMRHIYELFEYRVRKSIGSALSVLGGADLIFFQSKHLDILLPVVKKICSNFEFMGIKLKKDAQMSDNIIRITDKDSPVTIIGSKSARRDVLLDTINFLKMAH